MDVVQFFRSLPDSLYSEGHCLHLVCFEGLSDEAIADYERTFRIRLPDVVRRLYRLCNGCDLYGFELQPLIATDAFPERHLLTLHDWGNGDLDCVVTDSESPYSTENIVFMNHDPSVTVCIAPTLVAWLKGIVAEIQQWGIVLHPEDYRASQSHHGMYGNVLQALAGVDCELNR